MTDKMTYNLYKSLINNILALTKFLYKIVSNRKKLQCLFNRKVKQSILIILFLI